MKRIVDRIITDIEKIQVMLSNNFYNKKDVLRDLRKISRKVDEYIFSHTFKTKDKDTREELREILRSIVDILCDAEEKIIEMDEFDTDFKRKLNHLLLKIKKEIRTGLYDLQVTGEAQPQSIKLKQDIEKQLKKKPIVVPNEVRQLGEDAEKIYQALKVKETLTVSDLADIIGKSIEDVKNIIRKLEDEHIVATVKKGDDEYVVLM